MSFREEIESMPAVVDVHVGLPYQGDSALAENSSILDQDTASEIKPVVSGIDTLSTHGLDSTDEPKGSRLGNFIRRNKTRMILGVAATSTAVTLAADPLGDTTEKIIEAAPWVAGGVGASEALFVGGAAMMLAGVGDKIGNPFTIKNRMGEIAAKANNSKLFKTGFWINTTGAVGDFVVLSAGIGTQLPPHSWGVLGLTLLDLGVTVSVRKAILNGIDDNVPQTT